MRSIALALAGVVVSLAACAQSNAPATAAKPGAQANAGDLPATPGSLQVAAGSAAERVRDAILKVNPQVQIDQIKPSALPGFQEAIVGGQVVYVSDDGRFLMQGTLYDIEHKRNLAEDTMSGLRRKLMASMPVADRIVFAPASPKYTVTVFTDVECGYCRKLHSQIADYNRQGIAVQYVAFPRMGLGSEDYRKMVSVWCAADPRTALTDAKNDRPVPYRNCKNPVAMEYTLGQKMGLTGTPMILAEDGTQLGGYLPPDQLRQALDKLAEGSKPAASTAENGV
ncbi:MAG TPA: DsbC family protein [Xanthomonadaceae bacterium]|nr:DsbC family protein [Xanthomonadaceae bacterium]